MDRYDDLIERLKRSVIDQYAEAATEESIPPRLPLTRAQIEAAEKLLGFPIPPLLRRIYLEVSDGDWGPGYGLPPMFDKSYQSDAPMIEFMVYEKYEGVPANLWYLCSFGCGFDTYVKYDEGDLPVIFTDLDHLDEQFNCVYWRSGFTLETFFLAWLNGESFETLPLGSINRAGERIA